MQRCDPMIKSAAFFLPWRMGEVGICFFHFIKIVSAFTAVTLSKSNMSGFVIAF